MLCVCMCVFICFVYGRKGTNSILLFCVCVCVHAYVLFIQKGTNIKILFHVTHMICVILIDGPLLTF